tara:strand:- start:51 stop:461 length:411 start_codon:yes stop_codon:yes gene_type:complete
MAYTIKDARNPQWVDSDHNAIDLEVNFEELEEEWLSYTSSPTDVAEHSRTLYTRAAAGEFGTVSTEYVKTDDDRWTPVNTTVTEISSEALVQILLEKGVIDDDDVDSILVDKQRALGYTRPTKDGTNPEYHSPLFA